MSSAPAPGGAFDRYVQRGGAVAVPASSGNTVRRPVLTVAWLWVACVAGVVDWLGLGFRVGLASDADGQAFRFGVPGSSWTVRCSERSLLARVFASLLLIGLAWPWSDCVGGDGEILCLLWSKSFEFLAYDDISGYNWQCSF